MSDPTTETAQSFLPGLLAFLGGGTFMGLLGFIFNRKKTNAETLLIKANADGTVVGSALDFVKEIRAEAIDLRKRAADQEARAEALEQKINILEDHIQLQERIIHALKSALALYNPEHALLKEVIPKPPL